MVMIHRSAFRNSIAGFFVLATVLAVAGVVHIGLLYAQAVDGVVSILKPVATTTTLLIPNADQTDATFAAIAAYEERYFGVYGTYLQVLPGNAMPEHMKTSLLKEFDAVFPDQVLVNVYESPEGKGYQIVYTDSSTIKAAGYGPEAARFTYSHKLESRGASSTKEEI